MKRTLCIGMVLLLLLTACTAPTKRTVLGEDPTYGIYELVFSVECLSGGTLEEWDFVYTYNGEEIQSGHQIRFPLDLFSFYSIQVDAIERKNPDNSYHTVLSTAICDGGSGKTEITVTDSKGNTAVYKVICEVLQVGRQYSMQNAKRPD